ncbi:hypothetical protein [Streptomyces sp. CT34]|uniref:hypothetical protein n=1 Tax=Streptomyces sp. CT34 TaxID=1553907 RepID=UPI001F520F26|nr:hypothetical protein [Streptomyces sp. CT34]
MTGGTDGRMGDGAGAGGSGVGGSGADGSDGGGFGGGGFGSGGFGADGSDAEGPGAGGSGVEVALRERLRAADEAIETPPGLWARIQEPAARPVPLRVRHRRAYATALAAAATVAAVSLGVWWLARPGPARPGPAVPGPGTQDVTIRVFNSERACQGAHTLECALRLAKDPHKQYAAPGNSAGRVWHGDAVAARCVVTDGRLVRDEQGVTSTRWYLVRTAEGVQGWLPGARTRNNREVPACTGHDLPSA